MERPPPKDHRVLKTTSLLTKKLTTMKTTILKLSAFVLLFALMGAGCEKDESKDDNLVIKELPVLYLGYNLKAEETAIIRDQATFDKVFSKELVAQTLILQNIDFSKYDVLVGEGFTPYGPSKPKHKFIKLENLSYLYLLDVSNEIAGVPLSFCYGIIVNKLPTGAIVKFEVTKINE